MQSAKYQTTTPLKFLIVLYYYANVLTINQSKSLPGFWVVTSLDSINGRSLQTLLREKKTTQSNCLNLGYPLNYLHVPTRLPTYLPTFLHAHSPHPPTHPPTFLPCTLSPSFIHTYPPHTTLVPPFLLTLLGLSILYLMIILQEEIAALVALKEKDPELGQSSDSDSSESEVVSFFDHDWRLFFYIG